FKIPSKILPAISTYKIGDTITIISKFHRSVPSYSLENLDTGKKDMSGIKWKPRSAIYRIDSLDFPNNVEYSDFEKNFHFVNDKSYNYKIFKFSDNSSSLIGEYNYSNDTFSLSYKILALKAGTYYLESGSDNYPGVVDQQDYPGKCHGVGFEVYIDMNKNTNNNINFLKESPDYHWNTWIFKDTTGRFNKFGGYCFKVKP
ncbi:MAG TPA: hypothetical protein VK590_01890, partial [Saprospiraceae bacterium]|nr:hypothetical protein [Saprospiraceae bacterium]